MVRRVRQRLLRQRFCNAPDSWRGCTLPCWVLMPDHSHDLVQLHGPTSLSGVVRRFKSVSALLLNRQLGRSGTLWGAGFHDHALRSESDLLPAPRYLVANPLRAGIVERVGDYPFWNAVWLSDQSPF